LKYRQVQEQLQSSPKSWLITGAAGFIGSNLLEALLKIGQRVVGLDNLSTGNARNLEEVRSQVSPQQWKMFSFVEGDIQSPELCRRACQSIDYVLHQAALGSVPLSISDPSKTNASNVTGFLNMLVSARDVGVKRFVYASTCALYGDSPDLPKVEQTIGECLSPYAVTKRLNELYAAVFARCYGFESIGLRYFNVFGPRQDPNGPYAAVIPLWIAAMIKNQPIRINGDGETSRDFCYVDNVVQANLLAATTQNKEALNEVYNVGLGNRTTLKALFQMLRTRLLPFHAHLKSCAPIYQDFRPGDVRHSVADITKASRFLSYEPTHPVAKGLDAALGWYREKA
jgi:UDP-N-acetylglucosamine 4-epimerase